MTRLVRSTGDRLLGLFLKQVDAGACIPNMGDSCRTTQYQCYYGLKRQRYCYGTLSCTGTCSITSCSTWVVVGSC